MSKNLLPVNSILKIPKPIKPNTKGRKRLILFGNPEVKFTLKNEFIKTSRIAMDNKLEPMYKLFNLLAVLNCEKLIAFSIYSSVIPVV